MIRFFLGSVVLLQIIILLLPNSFVHDLGVSFLPYFIVIDSSILFVITMMGFKKTNIFYWVVTVLYIGTLSYLSYSYYTQYYIIHELSNQNIVQSNTWEAHTLSFFYGNIYYLNTGYNELLYELTQDDPDIIMLIEYSKYHDQYLTPLLQLDYPYVSRHVGWKGYDGDVIFSKYPLENIDHNSNVGLFSHVNINIDETNFLDITLIHTSAPIAPYYYRIREQQFEKLTSTLSDYYSGDNKNNNILVLGDFNVSPWSASYNNLNQKLEELDLYNITSQIYQTNFNRLVPYTRCLQEINRLCSHIDHIRWNMSTISLAQKTISGSDHLGFYGTLEL